MIHSHQDRALYWRLFEEKICDHTTEAYLRMPESEILFEKYRERHAQEILNLRNRLASPTAGGPGACLKIALSNHSLKNRAGSELWTYDVAKYLAREGMEVLVYSPELGHVADALSQASSIRVTSSAMEVQAFEPALLHVNHYRPVQEVVALLERTPTKIVNMCHGLLPRPGLPQAQGADQYCAASIVSKTKISLLTGADWGSIPILPNFFDEQRYRANSSLNRKHKALLFSSKATKKHFVALQDALAKCGYVLDAAGERETQCERPEQLLPQYDLVLAVGRSAIESLASGCRVILWDHGILGPMITSRNFWECLSTNFSLASKLLPYCLIDETEPKRWFEKQLSSTCREGLGQVYEMTRDYLSLDNIGSHLLEVYRQVVSPAIKSS